MRHTSMSKENQEVTMKPDNVQLDPDHLLELLGTIQQNFDCCLEENGIEGSGKQLSTHLLFSTRLAETVVNFLRSQGIVDQDEAEVTVVIGIALYIQTT